MRPDFAPRTQHVIPPGEPSNHGAVAAAHSLARAVAKHQRLSSFQDTLRFPNHDGRSSRRRARACPAEPPREGSGACSIAFVSLSKALRALAVAGVGMVALVVGIAFALLHRYDAVTLTPVVADAIRDIEAREYPRPVHRGPATPGRFGDAVERERAAFASVEVSMRTTPACFDERVPAPANCGRLLRETLVATEVLLAATRSETGGVGVARGVLAPWLSPERSKPGTPNADPNRASTHGGAQVRAVCRRAMLEAQTTALAGESDRAMNLCLDTLAWGRDSALGHSREGGRDAGWCIESHAAPVCRKLIGAASSDLRKRARETLERLRKTFPRSVVVVRDDETSVWLRDCGGFLDAPSRARLPPFASRIAGEVRGRPYIEISPTLQRASAIRRCQRSQEEIATRWQRPAELVGIDDKDDWGKRVESTLDELIRAAN